MNNDTNGMGTDSNASSEARIQDRSAQQINGNNNRKAPTRFFYEHPAVKDHGSGIALLALCSTSQSFLRDLLCRRLVACRKCPICDYTICISYKSPAVRVE